MATNARIDIEHLIDWRRGWEWRQKRREAYGWMWLIYSSRFALFRFAWNSFKSVVTGLSSSLFLNWDLWSTLEDRWHRSLRVEILRNWSRDSFDSAQSWTQSEPISASRHVDRSTAEYFLFYFSMVGSSFAFECGRTLDHCRLCWSIDKSLPIWSECRSEWFSWFEVWLDWNRDWFLGIYSRDRTLLLLANPSMFRSFENVPLAWRGEERISTYIIIAVQRLNKIRHMNQLFL